MMRIEFTLPERIVGFAGQTAGPGQQLPVQFRELVSPDNALLTSRLEQLQLTVFGHAPNFPLASSIDHVLVTIKSDLQCVAYVNELNLRAQVKGREDLGKVEKGAPVYIKDIVDLASVDLGVEIPADVAVILMRSFG